MGSSLETRRTRILPHIPWTGGLKIDRNPTLAHSSQLQEANDIVYGFDGTRLKRGGQSHRNRIPIPGGVIDDHFTKAPPGDWDASDPTPPVTLENDTEWRGVLTAGQSVSFTRDRVGKFPQAFTARVRIKTADLVTSGSFFELIVDPGTGSGLYRLGVKILSATGIQLETADGVYTTISSSNGTIEDFPFTSGGAEFYDIDNFHTWRFDMTAEQTIKIYFDELIIFTSDPIATVGEAGDNGQVTIRWSSADRLDVSIDYLAVEDGEESAVMGLWDHPRIAEGIINPTAHRMVAAVNARIYIDHGNHEFQLIAENYGDLSRTSPRLAIDCVSFMGKLIIAREGEPYLLRWDPSLTRAEPIVGSPPGTMLRVHRNRLWVMGDHSNPSRIYWSGLLNENVWTLEESGDFVDSGFEDIDPEDGGIGSGIGPSFHGQLIVYKTTGIYRIVGSNFSDFAMAEITKAIGCASHHTIQNVGNDQYFVSPYGVHSLLTTEKFGDYEDEFLSRDIRHLWNESINPDYLRFAWAINNEPLDRYEILLASGIDVDTTGILPNRVFCLHYGVRDELHPMGRWSVKRISGGSAAMYTDEDGRRHSFVGGHDGFVNRQDERYTHDFPVYRASREGGSQQHFILRHFGGDEIQDWASYPHYDGLVYNLLYDDPVLIAHLQDAVAAGKRYFRYYNVQSYPFSATSFGGTSPPEATWFNYLRNNLQFFIGASHRRMRSGNLVSIFPGFAAPSGEQHEMIPWGVITAGERAAAVEQMVSLANSPGGVDIPCSGLFLDQAWLIVESFQIDVDAGAQSGHGDTQESSPGFFNLQYAAAEAAFGDGGPWTTHTTAMMALYANVEAVLSPMGQYAILNGEHREQNGETMPFPWYLENAWNSPIDGATQAERWAAAKEFHAEDPRNVISVLVTEADNSTTGVPEALDHWEATGGWIAFSQNIDSAAAIANLELAYAAAAARLASMGFPA